MSSYEITFGRKPFNIPQYIVRTSDVAAIDDMLTSREVVFTEVRKKLLKAQAIMKHNADKKRRDVNFSEDN